MRELYLDKNAKRAAKEIFDILYHTDKFQSIIRLFQCDTNIKIDTSELGSPNYLRYVFLTSSSKMYNNTIRTFTEKDYKITVNDRNIVCRLTTQWYNFDVKSGTSGDSNYLDAVKQLVNKYYNGILHIESDYKITYVEFNSQIGIKNAIKFENHFIDISPRYIISLLAKPFVILTGNSGTGKTRIARQFAGYLKKENESGESNILIVPVGADWTDNTKILGYFNPLADDGAGAYVKTEIFRFLERANANPQIPFFLILDEMNLSHVERYFSDFLSKMEIPGSVFEIDGYGTLPYPKNLFVTGTVNIDETTYMFSPKVLDRANVIEFKPGKNAVLNSLTVERETETQTAEPGMAEGFLQLAEKIRNAPVTDYNNIDFTAAEPVLSELYDILEKAGFEFAFRTVKEIRLYLVAAYELAEQKEDFSLNGNLDIQILQKILPKIYGNRQQIGTLLEELKAFFEKENFTSSLQKITQMAERLNRFQFVSFV